MKPEYREQIFCWEKLKFLKNEEKTEIRREKANTFSIKPLGHKSFLFFIGNVNLLKRKDFYRNFLFYNYLRNLMST
jgi:hypothetical protein